CEINGLSTEVVRQTLEDQNSKTLQFQESGDQNSKSLAIKPCEGMKYSDFEKLKWNFAKHDLSINRECVFNGLSKYHITDLPKQNQDMTQNKIPNSKSIKQEGDGIFLEPGSFLVTMTEHGLKPIDAYDTTIKKSQREKKKK
ncbi:hypothetical protein RFI_28491, partial [Reticulomyxa filosa]